MPRLIDNLVHFNGKHDESSPALSHKMGLVNLRDLVEATAHKWYKDNEKDSTKAKWGRTYNWKELVKEIDWRSLKVRHDPVIYTDLEMPGAPKNHILFRSSFLNDTNREQDYNLKAVRRTVSTCSFSIFEGYTTEQTASLELQVPLPKCVLEASTGFRREYTLEQSRDKQVEEELTWSVESNIRIPGMSQTTAELIVQEDEYHGTFEIKSYFVGEIRVKLYKDAQEILSLEFGDLEDLFPREKGFRKDSRGIYRITRGECKARFGISQKVELHAKPLPTQDTNHRTIQQQDLRKNSMKDLPAPSAPVTILRELVATIN
ncbi:unnamed protein product [Adineta steineri]|uniref:Uncharacterized protein n=1 Tax=Adineta steineri TaxID=433720 RepID=A0A814C9J9_9BILA|nr:unnamed protein product [Adineta steineri]CAF0938937.1 unnamed protein product [Adineta steineri]CAF0964748.1 unnamed protein product [Adineta steineri]CAF3557945.1 unnamed protein product [Adineta steineri]